MSRLLLPAAMTLALATVAGFLMLSERTAYALTITVDSGLDTVADDGECTFREALANANNGVDGQPNADCAAGDPNGGDDIVFTYSGTITMTGSFPDIGDDLAIDGGGEIVLDAAGLSRHLRVDDGSEVTITGMEFINGMVAGQPGGSIRILDGALTVMDCSFNQNSAQNGGAIDVFNGTLVVNDSSFTGNGADVGGGAISIDVAGAAVLNDVDFSMNTAADSGGAIYVSSFSDGVPLLVHGGSFSQNAANTSGGAIAAGSPVLIDSGAVFSTNNADLDGGAIIASAMLTIDTASFLSNAANVTGGAMRIYGVAELSNLTVAQNVAASGGGIYADEGSAMTIAGSVFNLNDAINGAGGAIAYRATGPLAGPLELSMSQFTENAATGEGGAIATTSDLVVTDSTFDQNEAETGGALHIEDSSADITRSTFTGNAALVAGGAIYTDSSDDSTFVIISESTIDDNEALAGAGFVNAAGIAGILSSTVSRNSATGGTGGGVSNSGLLEIANSTISTNAADLGGGGLANSGTASLVNTSFVANAALDDGAGIRNENTGILAISNSLVALGNAGDNCAFFGTESGTNGSNLADDDSCDMDLFVEVDELELGPLANNGGPMLTHLPADTSPAVDGGNDGICLDDDQRGEERIALEHCDVGAVEVQDIAFVPTGDLFLPNLASQVDHQ